jgi:hypothetical protein
MVIEVPGWAFALALLAYLVGGVLTAALINALRAQNHAVRRLYQSACTDRDIARRQLRHANAELATKKAFGGVVQRGE